jgi:hypothetical protein
MLKCSVLFFLFLCSVSCASTSNKTRGVASDIEKMQDESLRCGTRKLKVYKNKNVENYSVAQIGEIGPKVSTVDGFAFMESGMFLAKHEAFAPYPPTAQVKVEKHSIKSIRIEYAESKNAKNFSYSIEENPDVYKVSGDGRVIGRSVIVRVNGNVYDFYCRLEAPIQEF